MSLPCPPPQRSSIDVRRKLCRVILPILSLALLHPTAAPPAQSDSPADAKADHGMTTASKVAGQADLRVVEDGAPLATIVIALAATTPAKDDPAAQKVAAAAHDLQGYIRKISGATLPIVDDKSPVAGSQILVGRSTATDRLKSAIPSGLTPQRNEEGYLITSSKGHLVLAGNDAGPYHGTEYAVSDFLNRLGVRWFMPGEFGEVVPSMKTIGIPELSVRGKPDFRVRNWWLHTTPEMAAQERQWKIRNKMNPDQVFALPADSSVRNFVAGPDPAKAQADLLARNPDGTINPHLPNLSNPATVDIAAKKVEDYFRAHPDAGSIGIAPDDGMPRDFTPETVKLNQGFTDLDGREGVLAEMSSTEEWLDWINAVTREVNKALPDKIITTNGYANRNMPPFGVKIDPHVSIMFAAIWSDTLHAYDDAKSWQMVRQGEMLRRWCQLDDKVWVYGYDYTMLVTALTPVPTTRKLQRDFPLMKKWGVKGFLDETRNIWAEHGITTGYVRARLEWDAGTDVDALLDDYFDKWYGAAAKPAHAFWDALEDVLANTPMQGHEDRILPWVYTPELMQALATDVSAAEKAADTPRDRLHVQIDRLIFEHMQAYTRMNAAELAGDYAEAARQADTMLAIRPKLHAIDSFLMMPQEKNAKGGVDYDSGVWYWGIADRAAYYRHLADIVSGKAGKLVAMIPDEAAFNIDPRDEGRFAGWYESAWDVSAWNRITTTRPFYLQGFMDKEGYPYLGNAWYRFKVDVPASARAERVFLYGPVVETEAWVWVNGQYVGHRPYREAYERPNEMNFDVTSALQPGKTNVVSIRVSTSLNRTAMAGGLTGRLFLYAPVAGESAAPSK